MCGRCSPRPSGGRHRLWGENARLEKTPTLGEGWREACRHDDDGGAERDPEEDRHHDAEPAVVSGIEVEPELHHEARGPHEADQTDGSQDCSGEDVAPAD